MKSEIKINKNPLPIEQLKLLKETNEKVRFKCLYSGCKFFNGIHTIKEIDEHMKKEHHKGGLFKTKSDHFFSDIKVIDD